MGKYSNEYRLVDGSVIYHFNPFISAYTSIEAISQVLIAEDQSETKNLSEATIYHSQVLRSNQTLKIIGVRVSFDIVPKNGSKKIRIIKTFAANQIT